MQIDTAGTYTLKYTAEDECGNITEVEREVVAEQLSYRTVLYTDGTFIINEKDSDQAANEALHGVATNVYDPFDPNGNTDIKRYIFTEASERPWHEQQASIRKVEIGSNIEPTSTSWWFDYFSYCTSMTLDGLNTSAVTDMHYMFRGCQALTMLDVTHFDTSAVTDMSNMFGNCQALTSLDLSSFNTSAVTNMSYMFYDCRALTTLDVTHFDTSAVTDMHYMFRGCRALTMLDVTHFDTSAVTDMSNMFYDCRALTALDVTHFDTSAVTDMSYMFRDCRALTMLDITHFNTSAVTKMNSMFYNCQALTSLDLSSFNTSAVTNMSYMFYDCRVLATIYVSSAFVVTQVTNSSSMFTNMSTNLVGGAGTTWSSSNPTDKTYAHIDGGTSNPGYFTAKA